MKNFNPFVIQILNDSEESVENFEFKPFQHGDKVKVSFLSNPIDVPTWGAIEKIVIENVSEIKHKIPDVILVDGKGVHNIKRTYTFPNKDYLVAYHHKFNIDYSSIRLSLLTPKMKLKIHFYPVGWDKRSIIKKFWGNM